MKKKQNGNKYSSFDTISCIISVAAFAYIIWSIMTMINGSKGILDGIISIAIGLMIIICFTSIAQLYDKNEDLKKQIAEIKKNQSLEIDKTNLKGE